MEHTDNTNGPWTETTTNALSALVESRRKGDGEWADETNGVIVFVRKGERLFRVVDATEVWGEDAVSTLCLEEVSSLDGEDAWMNGWHGEDVEELFAAAS